MSKEKKEFTLYIEWDGDGKKEERTIWAEDIREARYIAKHSIFNPSINYGYSWYVTEATQLSKTD